MNRYLTEMSDIALQHGATIGSQDRMDYTVIGNAVNLTARLQSHSRRSTAFSWVMRPIRLAKDEVSAEEQTPIKVKGFTEPVRCYKVLRLHDHLAEEGTVIREERDGSNFTSTCKSATKLKLSILGAFSRASRLNSCAAHR